MNQEKKVFTYQTRFDVTGIALDSYAELFCSLERKLFAALMAKKALLVLKKNYIHEHGITARQFNALLFQVTGKIQSVKEHQKLEKIELKEKISTLTKKLPKFKDKVLFGKKRRLSLLKKKLKNLEEKIESGKVNICFGGKKFFRKQFETEDHQQWKQEWQAKRNQSFFSIGSKDETAGNQSCSFTKDQEGNLILRVRLPSCLEKEHGKYLIIENLHFKYGHQEILDVLEENLQRASLLKLKDPLYHYLGQAISCRFLKDEKGWRLFVSISTKKREIISRSELGVIGVDININHLAIAELDHFGNIIDQKILPLNTYGKDKHQTLALIQEVAKEIVSLAKEKKKPIVLEQLDFQKKKQNLRDDTPKRARMLSSFAYGKILEAIKSKAYKEGIDVLEVSPAYTSMIGHIKYAKRFGLSIHVAAAFCIGRKGLDFLETLPCGEEVKLLTKGGAPLLFKVPVRNPQLDNDAYLKVVAKKYRAAHAEHFKAERIRSSQRDRNP